MAVLSVTGFPDATSRTASAIAPPVISATRAMTSSLLDVDDMIGTDPQCGVEPHPVASEAGDDDRADAGGLGAHDGGESHVTGALDDEGLARAAQDG